MLLSFNATLSAEATLTEIKLNTGYVTQDFTVYAIPSGLVQSSNTLLKAGNYLVNLNLKNGADDFALIKSLALSYTDKNATLKTLTADVTESKIILGR